VCILDPSTSAQIHTNGHDTFSQKDLISSGTRRRVRYFLKNRSLEFTLHLLRLCSDGKQTTHGCKGNKPLLKLDVMICKDRRVQRKWGTRNLYLQTGIWRKSGGLNCTYTVVTCEKWDSLVQIEGLETENSEVERTEEDVLHVMKRICYTYFWNRCKGNEGGGESLNNKWQNITYVMANEKIISCTSPKELEKLRTFSHNTKCKWKNQAKKLRKAF
jgi:hypothetical protein